MLKSVSFNITEQEIRQKSHAALTRKQLRQVLSYIENDAVLWSAIDQAIESAVHEELGINKPSDVPKNPPPRVNRTVR